MLIKILKLIVNGEGVFKGNSVTVNNRTYDAHANGTLYPVSGEGFATLNRGEYKIFQMYNSQGDTPKLNSILQSMKNKGSTNQETIDKAYQVWKGLK